MNNHKLQKGDLVRVNVNRRRCPCGFIIGFGGGRTPWIQFADGVRQYYATKFLKLLAKANK